MLDNNIPPHGLIHSLLNTIGLGPVEYNSAIDNPQKVAVQPQQIKSYSNKATPVPQEFQNSFQSVYKMYPTLHKGLPETVAMMESSMGKNTSNSKNDFGGYGYIGGLTKTGHYADTVKNYKKDPSLDYKPFKAGIKGMDTLDNPNAAIHGIASVIQQLQQNNPNMSPEDLYFKAYNANPKVDTPERRKQFNEYLQQYSS